MKKIEKCDEARYLRAHLILAKRLGLIDDDSLEALESRRLAKIAENEECERLERVYYGPITYTPRMYAEYEMTRFRLDFVEPVASVKASGLAPKISKNKKMAFYKENADLFTRCTMEPFSYKEVELVIEKRLKEIAYEKLIEDILCEPG